MYPAASPRTTASCTGRVSVNAAGDVQFRIPTPNACCWAQSQCPSSASSLLLARCSSGDWASKQNSDSCINDSCSNPKGEFWFSSPELEQGCSPVPLAHPEDAGTPGSIQHSVSDTHWYPRGPICRSCTSQPGSDPSHSLKNQARLCQAVRALYNIAAAQEPPHTSQRDAEQVLIPLPPMQPTLTRCPHHSRLPLPGAYSCCSFFPSAVSPALPCPLPFPLRRLPDCDVSAALPPHHTPAHPAAALFPNGCHSDRRGIPILCSISPTAALPKEPGAHEKGRVLTGNSSRRRPAIPVWS